MASVGAIYTNRCSKHGFGKVAEKLVQTIVSKLVEG